jgi:hypothetical protein
MGNFRAVLLIALLSVASQTCAAAETENKDAREAARSLLEPGFHFVLAMPDYEPRQIVHDADPFSNWGDLVLVHGGSGKVTKEDLRKRLLHLAKAAGWRPVKELPDVALIENAQHYGMAREREDLDMLRRVGPKNESVYSCRIWISDDGRSILVAYRSDSH